VRQPELEPGNMLNKVQVEPDEGAVRNKIAELVDEVRLTLSWRVTLGLLQVSIGIFSSKARLLVE
jgi:hypothetical protein